MDGSTGVCVDPAGAAVDGCSVGVVAAGGGVDGFAGAVLLVGSCGGVVGAWVSCATKTKLPKTKSKKQRVVQTPNSFIFTTKPQANWKIMCKYSRRVGCLPVSCRGLKPDLFCCFHCRLVQAVSQSSHDFVDLELSVCSEDHFQQNFSLKSKTSRLVWYKPESA